MDTETLLVLKQVVGCNGFEAYRQVLLSNEPMNKNRAMSRLGLIMNWPAFNNKSSYLMPSSRSWATILVMKSSVASIVQRTLKTWLQLSFKDNTTYAQMREAGLNYDRSTTKWSGMMGLGRDSGASDTSGLMEVDHVKGFEKGKGKGKDGKGNKGGGKDFHKGSYWQDRKSKGKGKNEGDGNYKGKGKGKDGKSKGKGKREERHCHTCGKQRHLAKDCYSKQTVRQVQENEQTTPSSSANSSSFVSTTWNLSFQLYFWSSILIPICSTSCRE